MAARKVESVKKHDTVLENSLPSVDIGSLPEGDKEDRAGQAEGNDHPAQQNRVHLECVGDGGKGDGYGRTHKREKERA